MRRFYILTLIIVCFACLQSQAKTCYWAGSTSTWSSSGNWIGGVPANGDVVNIGITYGYTAVPLLITNINLAGLNFGMVNATGGLTISSGVLLTVSGDVTMQFSTNTNTNSVINIQQTVVNNVGGAIKCTGFFSVGSTTQQPTPFAILGLGFQINNTNTITANIDLQNFTVDKDLTINSTSSATATIGTSTSANVNNATLNLNNGSLIVTGNIATANTGGHTSYPAFTYSLLNIVPLTNFPAVAPKAQLIVNPTGDVATNTATLSVGGTVTVFTGDAIDFFGPGLATCNTIYAGNTSASTAQTVYSANQTGLDVSPALYQNLAFSGINPKSLQAGDITMTGNWTSTGAAITGASSNTVYFQNASTTLAQTLDDAAGVTFNNVNFQKTGTTKTISSGSFSVAGTGVLTVDSAVTFNTGNKLTLLSTTAGSATVATLRHNAVINGTAKVQRFVQGNLNVAKRGYRLMSSPVFTGTVGTSPAINCYDFNYLLNDAFVSGAAGGGFNTPGTNPTIFLYREDVSSSNAGFVAGNWKGVASITANNIATGTQFRLGKINKADSTVYVPVGNGFLFYFRGNKTDNSTQTGTKVTAPYDYPEDVTFTQTGQLNTGPITVRLWYNGSSSTFTYTNVSNVSNSGVRGFTFVGNPYPSTINFEKFNRQGTKSSIYSAGFAAGAGKIWVLNASNKQYETYVQASTISTAADTTTKLAPGDAVATGAASNFIASGQGFFIRVTGPGAGLSFKETAKTNTQPATGSINSIMSVPANAGMLAFSSATPAAAPSPLSLLRFVMAKDSINNDEAVLVLNNTTPNTFNDASDAEDLNGNGALVSLSVMSSDNVATSIKRVKFPQIGAQSVRLLVDATASGTYHLQLKNLNNIPNAYNVWLIDSLMKDSLDLKHNNNYDFNIDKNNPLTFGTNRFSVVIRQNPEAMMHALSFAASKTIQGAQLTWRTENEGNNHTFLVEKSIDGKTFDQIGQVSSNSSGDYAYTDVTPAKGMNYYRVKLQDMVLNTLSYTNVLSLNYADAATTSLASNISVYPNPATNLVNIKMSPDEPTENSYSIKISNSTGRVVKQITTSSATLQTDVTQFLPGTYMIQVVKISDNKLQGQSKFVKL